ncbi:hypothetical protein DPEC_G00115750 [Dallia pectoralis]|uniref:Uncharacterized protein n=1 Tax=Dallia pectoralis TaxID=75939 RepID=A0ACC2GUY6_DALPE|nr:hypothetical protein DPEC_G00115750 [Dallia pectoralis]
MGKHYSFLLKAITANMGAVNRVLLFVLMLEVLGVHLGVGGPVKGPTVGPSDSDTSTSPLPEDPSDFTDMADETPTESSTDFDASGAGISDIWPQTLDLSDMNYIVDALPEDPRDLPNIEASPSVPEVALDDAPPILAEEAGTSPGSPSLRLM